MQIEAKNAGPIEGTFEIDLSTGFGAYQLCGGCGTGKTTMLDSLNVLAGHKTPVNSWVTDNPTAGVETRWDRVWYVGMPDLGTSSLRPGDLGTVQEVLPHTVRVAWNRAVEGTGGLEERTIEVPRTAVNAFEDSRRLVP